MVVPAGDVDAFTEKIGELIRYVDQRMQMAEWNLSSISNFDSRTVENKIARNC